MQTKYRVLGALWFFNLANYIDRAAIAFVGPVIISSLHLGPRSFGIVLSSFGIGYALGQIPGGVLADRWGVKGLLIGAPLLWALFTGLTGLVATIGGFVIVRGCLGLAEGLSNGATFKLQGDVFPSRERTGSSAAMSTAGTLGPAFAGPLVGLVVASHGWRSVFFVLMIPPIAAALLNVFVIPARGAHAQAFEAAAEATMALETPTTFFGMFRQPALWLFVLMYFAFNIAYWGYNGWMPSYLALARHIDLKHVGLLGGIPYLFGFLGLVVSGWLGTVLHRWRSQMLLICFLLVGAALYLAFASPSLPGAMAGLCCASLFLQGSIPLFASLMLDVAPPTGRASYAGVVFTAGQIGGVVAPSVIGVLVQKSGGFASGFTFMEGALVVAAAMTVFIPLLAKTTTRNSPEKTA